MEKPFGLSEQFVSRDSDKLANTLNLVEIYHFRHNGSRWLQPALDVMYRKVCHTFFVNISLAYLVAPSSLWITISQQIVGRDARIAREKEREKKVR